MDLKPSSIVKNSNIKANIIDNTKNIYSSLSEITNNIEKSRIMSNTIRSKIVDLINNNLTSEDHIEIYKMLRKTKSKKFFSSNNSKTFFNMKELDNILKWKLYKLVLLLSENTNNNINKSNALKEHETNINKLNKKITVKKAIYKHNEFSGISEKEKYNNMLKLNSNI